jgi:hypothetical protein
LYFWADHAMRPVSRAELMMRSAGNRSVYHPPGRSITARRATDRDIGLLLPSVQRDTESIINSGFFRVNQFSSRQSWPTPAVFARMGTRRLSPGVIRSISRRSALVAFPQVDGDHDQPVKATQHHEQ